ASRQQLSLDLFSTEAERRGECERIRERQTSLRERREAAGARLRELEARLGGVKGQVGGGAGAGRGKRAEGGEGGGRVGRTEQAIEAHAASVLAAETALSRVRQDAAAAESRLETLLELKRTYEGVSEGVKGLLEEGGRVRGLLGMVADVLDVPAKYLGALE